MLCVGMWDVAPLELSLLTFQSRLLNVQICMVVQSCMLLEKDRKTVFMCLFVHLCVHAYVHVFDECKYHTVSLHLLLRCPVCRLLHSHVEQPLHNNEKWQKREYHSRLWPGLAGSVRPGAPRWQSPYFWEDRSVIRLIYFTHTPCNWTAGCRFNQSCQSLHWKRIWTESKVEKWKGSLFGVWCQICNRLSSDMPVCEGQTGGFQFYQRLRTVGWFSKKIYQKLGYQILDENTECISILSDYS